MQREPEFIHRRSVVTNVPSVSGQRAGALKALSLPDKPDLNLIVGD